MYHIVYVYKYIYIHTYAIRLAAFSSPKMEVPQEGPHRAIVSSHVATSASAARTPVTGIPPSSAEIPSFMVTPWIPFSCDGKADE